MSARRLQSSHAFVRSSYACARARARAKRRRVPPGGPSPLEVRLFTSRLNTIRAMPSALGRAFVRTRPRRTYLCAKVARHQYLSMSDKTHRPCGCVGVLWFPGLGHKASIWAQCTRASRVSNGSWTSYVKLFREPTCPHFDLMAIDKRIDSCGACSVLLLRWFECTLMVAQRVPTRLGPFERTLVSNGTRRRLRRKAAETAASPVD